CCPFSEMEICFIPPDSAPRTVNARAVTALRYALGVCPRPNPYAAAARLCGPHDASHATSTEPDSFPALPARDQDGEMRAQNLQATAISTAKPIGDAGIRAIRAKSQCLDLVSRQARPSDLPCTFSRSVRLR